VVAVSPTRAPAKEDAVPRVIAEARKRVPRR
jgi:hypothetical protein